MHISQIIIQLINNHSKMDAYSALEHVEIKARNLCRLSDRIKKGNPEQVRWYFDVFIYLPLHFFQKYLFKIYLFKLHSKLTSVIILVDKRS